MRREEKHEERKKFLYRDKNRKYRIQNQNTEKHGKIENNE